MENLSYSESFTGNNQDHKLQYSQPIFSILPIDGNRDKPTGVYKDIGGRPWGHANGENQLNGGRV